MKKHIVLVLLVPILALTLISCDADMRSGFASFLGGLGGNLYIDGGLVTANKADVKAATTTIAGLGSGSGAKVFEETDTKTDTFGIEVDIPGGVTSVMKPQPKADQDKLKNDLANTLNSTQQTAELKEELKKPVDDPDRIAAVQGTVEVFNATIDALAAELAKDSGKKELKDAIDKLKLGTVAPGDTITEGDVLLVQPMTNLVSNTIGTLDGIKGGGSLGDNLEDNQDSLLAIIDDALFTAQIASELVGASDLNLFEGLDLNALLGKGVRQSRDGDDDGISLDEAGDFISVINSFGPKLVRLFDLTLSGNEYGWKTGGYRKMISTFRTYRLSLERALAFYRAGNLSSINQASLETLDETTPVIYLLSVFLTEADAFDKGFGAELIPDIMNSNKKFAAGTLTTSDKIFFEADSGEKDFDAFADSLHKKGEDYVRAFFENTQLLDEIGGSKILGAELKKFLTEVDDDDKTGFDDFWSDLAAK